MLHILWMLLKIIGIIILVILGLVLVTLGVVFLVPLKYTGTAVLDKEIEKSTAQLKFSWFLHLFSGNVSYIDKQLSYEIKVVGKKIQLDKANDNIEDIVENKKQDEVTEEKLTEMSEKNEGNLAKKITRDVVSDVISDVSEKSEETESKKQVKKKKAKKESVLKKIKYTFQNICDKIKMLKQKKNEVEEFLTNEAHKSAFGKLWKETKKLLKALKPKKFELNAHFGFEDPSLTGKILAVLSMLYPFYGDNIRIQPDFENVIIEGDLYLKGKIRVIHTVKMAWNLIWNKNVRITLKDILKSFK